MPFFIKYASLNDKPIIHSLLQPYLAELSGLPDEYPIYKDENGVYLYPYLDAYWQENVRFPYLLYSNAVLAGFALVRKDKARWEMSEFYVKPEFRRLGVAEACAMAIFQRHPGTWSIGFNKHNLPSRALWKKLAVRLSDGDITDGETDASHDYLLFTVDVLAGA
jgi:predicted acetyltransferase